MPPPDPQALQQYQLRLHTERLRQRTQAPFNGFAGKMMPAGVELQHQALVLARDCATVERGFEAARQALRQPDRKAPLAGPRTALIADERAHRREIGIIAAEP